MTLLETLNKATLRLEKAGVDTPKLDAEVLLSHILNCERHELYTNTSIWYLLTYASREVFESYITRRCEREPVAYIRGFKEFWSINIKVTPDVLIPRPETEMLVEKALECLTQNAERGTQDAVILDLCTGSGCIAAALAKELPEAQITVVDISQKALDLAKENLAFAKERVTFVQGNLFENISGKFDLIISNPPYIPTYQIEQLEADVSQYEPHLALDGGKEGLDFIEKIKETAPQFLKPKGWLVMEAGPKIFTWTN